MNSSSDQSGDRAAATASGRPGSGRPLRRSIFAKYFLAFFAAVVAPLVINGASETWFGYRDQRSSLDQRLHVEALAAAGRIQNFLDGIREQMQWAVQLPWTGEEVGEHRIDALRLMRQVPAIVDLMLVDGDGTERLEISRTARDVINGDSDRSRDPEVVGARRAHAWYGPVTLNRGSEPYMRIAVAGPRSAAGVAVAVINLKFIWDVISEIHVGQTGIAFVMDDDGRLIAHPDIDFVLRGADARVASRLRLIKSAAASGPAAIVEDIEQRPVLAALAPVPGAGWWVIAEQPLTEALAPILAASWRTLLLVILGAVFALALAYFLARRMTGPIRLLEEGAARIGAQQFDHKIAIATGDELERLAHRFNQMAGELALSKERSERIERLKRFLSPQVAEIIENSPDGTLLEARRCDVAVVFCDLRGFTDFSARVDPEDIMRVLSEYYQALGSCIMRFDATLTHFSGDGLMVLVNAPLPCRDNPAARAIHMAGEMQRAVQSLITAWRARGHHIGFGIGIAHGVATVGRVGYEGRNDYTAIGPVVNLAARLCTVAGDGQILVDAAAAATAGSDVDLAPIGRRSLKGFLEPVEVFAHSPRA